MFNSLSERLSQTLQSMGKKARLTEDNIAQTLKEVRKALLEADVALPVVPPVYIAGPNPCTGSRGPSESDARSAISESGAK
jgi:Signal recognition particle GTPase